MSGYSATPLVRKLGLKPPLTLVVVDPPPDYGAWLGQLPAGVRVVAKSTKPVQAAHVFVTERKAMEKQLKALRGRLEQNGFLWVSWPKKAARVATDISEDVVRAVALPLGFVDIKVCAVSDIWSGLKLVIRRRERTG